MEIIDVRKYSRNDDSFSFIHVDENDIYFLKDEEDGRKHVYKYNNKKNMKKSIYSFDSNLMVKDTFVTNNKMFFVLQDYEESFIEIYYISKEDGREIGKNVITMNASCLGMTYLNEQFVILYTEQKHLTGGDYSKFLNMFGMYEISYLFDRNNEELIMINDKDFNGKYRGKIYNYNVNEIGHLILEQYMLSEKRKVEEYMATNDKREMNDEKYIDYIKHIAFSDFIYQIKNNYENLGYTILVKSTPRIITRYVGMDRENIYYREKNIDTNIERINKIDKVSFQKGFLQEISHESSDIYYDVSSTTFKVYDILNEDEQFNIVIGKYNTKVKIRLSKEAGDFIKVLDNRFIISEKMRDGNATSRTVLYVYDTQANKEESYEGHYKIYKNNIIIF